MAWVENQETGEWEWADDEPAPEDPGVDPNAGPSLWEPGADPSSYQSAPPASPASPATTGSSMDAQQQAAYMQWLSAGGVGAPPSWVFEDRNAVAAQQQAAQAALAQVAQLSPQAQNMFDQSGTGYGSQYYQASLPPPPPAAPAAQASGLWSGTPATTVPMGANGVPEPVSDSAFRAPTFVNTSSGNLSSNGPSDSAFAPPQTYNIPANGTEPWTISGGGANGQYGPVVAPLPINQQPGYGSFNNTWVPPSGIGAPPQPTAPQAPIPAGPITNIPSLPIAPGTTITPSGPVAPGQTIPPPYTTNAPTNPTTPVPVTPTNPVPASPVPTSPAPTNPTPTTPTVPGTNITINNGDPNATARNLGSEGANTLAAQVALAPTMLAQYQQFAPLYAQTDLSTLGQSLFGPGYSGSLSDINRRLTQDAITQTNQGNRAVRETNIADMDEFAGDALAIQHRLNTPLYGNMDRLDAIAQGNIGSDGRMQNRPGYMDTLRSSYLSNGGNNFERVTPQSVNTFNVSADRVNTNANAREVGNGGFINPGSLQSPGNVSANSVTANNSARDVNASSVFAPSGFERVQASTAFSPVQAAAGDYGLATATQRLSQGGPSAIQQTLESQAQRDLGLGRSLSEEDRRNAQQAAREGWSARGLINSNGAVAEEVLNRDALGRQRENERRQFAQGVDATGFGQRQQGYANALGLSDASRGYAGLGLQAQTANLGAQMQGNALGLDAQRLNQSAGLQTNQLGLQGQLANQDAGLRAQLANQQRDITGSQQGLQAQLANQDAGLRAQLANQQTGYNVGLANLNTGLEAQRINAANSLQSQLANQQRDLAVGQQSLQGQQLNQDAGLRAQLANQQASNQTQQFNAANALQAGLANQAAGFQNRSMNDALGLDMARLESTQDQQAWNNLMQQTQLRSQTAFNPFSVLGQTSNQGNNNSLFGMGGAATANNQNVYNQFNPYNAYSSDLYNTNYNAQIASRLNADNVSAGKQAGWMGMIGSIIGGIGGGLASKCWVAREIYGADDPRWLVFRSWLEDESPRWFHNLYVEHGESFAAYIHDKPTLKAAVREWMDARLSEYVNGRDTTAEAFSIFNLANAA